MPGQDIFSCGATLLGANTAPAFIAYITICRPFLTKGHTPSRILHQMFQLALGSPFGFGFFAVISANTALCGKKIKTYLLFFNGFPYYNIFF